MWYLGYEDIWSMCGGNKEKKGTTWIKQGWGCNVQQMRSAVRMLTYGPWWGFAAGYGWRGDSMRVISRGCVVLPSCHPSAHLFADFLLYTCLCIWWRTLFVYVPFCSLFSRLCKLPDKKNSDSLAKGEKKAKIKRKASEKARIVDCFP